MPMRPPTVSLKPAAILAAEAADLEHDRFYRRKPWRDLRAAFLASAPLCVRCPPDQPTHARQVHHKIERRHRPDLELSWENLEGLCDACHAKAHKGTRRYP